MMHGNVKCPEVEVFTLQVLYRTLPAVLATGWLAMGVYLLADHLLIQENYRLIFILDLPSIVMATAILWSQARFRIECDDRSLLRREFRTRVIRFDMVKRRHFHPLGTFDVHSDGEVIKLTREIERRDYLSRLIIEKVKGNPGLEIAGESRWFETYMGSKRDSTET